MESEVAPARSMKFSKTPRPGAPPPAPCALALLLLLSAGCTSVRLGSAPEPVLRRFAGAVAATSTLPAGGDTLLWSERGAGVIRRLWIRARSHDTDYLDKVVLEARWDDADNPAIAAPLSALFAIGAADSPALATEHTDWAAGGMSLRLAMPFATSAELRLRNVGEAELSDVAWEVDVESGFALGRDVEHLHARHFLHSEGDELDRFEIDGAGRYVGTTVVVRGGEAEACRLSLVIDHDPSRTLGSLNLPTFFGGGGYRERSSWISPGSGMRWLADDLAVAYRWHDRSGVLFQRSLALVLEHQLAAGPAPAILGTAFWYQVDPAGRSPASYVSRPPRTPRATDAIECEDLLPPLYSSGDRCVADITTLLGSDWSGNRQLLFLADAAGDFVVLELPRVAPGRYDLHLVYTVGFGYGAARASIEGSDRDTLLLAAAPGSRPKTERRVMEGVRVADRETPLRLRISAAGEGAHPHVGLDYLRLAAAAGAPSNH